MSIHHDFSRRATRVVKCVVLLAVFAFHPPRAQAQASPPLLWHLDVAGNYSYVRTNFSGNGGVFNVNGGSASLGYNFFPSVAIVGDFGVYRFSSMPSGVTTTMYTYMGGPRYTIRKFRFGTPFVQGLVGGGRLDSSAGSVSAGENGLAFAAGGGLDLQFTSHIAIRIVQADYLMTRFPRVDGSSASQNNVRVSAGIVFHLGER